LIQRAETCYSAEPNDLGAQRYLQSSMATINQLKQSMAGRQQKSAQEMLKIAVQTKDQERVTLLSNAKLVEANASPEQMTVINNANRRAMEKLNAMLADSSSYDASIRAQKMKLIDSDLAMMERTVSAIKFSDELGKRAPPPHTAHGRLGHLNNEQKKTVNDVVSHLDAASKMHKKDAGALRRHFRDASANLSGGLAGFQTLSLDKSNGNQILSAVNNNLEYLRLRGKLTPEEKLHLESQIDSIPSSMFANQEVYNESVNTYKKTMSMSNLGGIFKLDSPEESKANWARLFNTGVVLLVGGWVAKETFSYFLYKGKLK